jgi:hypothetical protein
MKTNPKYLILDLGYPANSPIELNTDNFFKLSKQDQDYIRENFLPKGLEHWKFKEYYKGLNKSTNGLHHGASSSAAERLGKRSYSTKSFECESLHKLQGFKFKTCGAREILPVKFYPNAYKDKVRIITENRSKSGVYRLTNRVNGKTYIGSSKNLGKRLKFYFNLAAILYTLKRSNYFFLPIEVWFCKIFSRNPGILRAIWSI